MNKSQPHPITAVPIRLMKQSDIAACPFLILLPSHYREDGSCKCSNAEHRAMMIAEWGYSADAFTNVALVD